MSQKKILLIPYHFYPESNPRSVRWQSLLQQWAKYRNCKIDLIIQKSQYKLPFYKNVKYHFFYFRKKNWVPKILYKFIWTILVVKKIAQLLSLNNYDTVISSSHPSVSHIAVLISKFFTKNRTKWIAEFGDPISTSPTLSRKFYNFLNRIIDQQILNKSNLIIVPIPESKNSLLNNFSNLKPAKIKVIPQAIFFKKNKIKNSSNKKNIAFNKDKINIIYAGSFYPKIRSPIILFESLKLLKAIEAKKYHMLNFHFFGKSHTIRSIIKEYLFLIEDKVVKFHGEVSRDTCRKMYQQADYLLNISNDSKNQLPSKLIEYLIVKKPIISINYKKSIQLNWDFILNVNNHPIHLFDFFKKLEKNHNEIDFSTHTELSKYYSPERIASKYFKIIRCPTI